VVCVRRVGEIIVCDSNGVEENMFKFILLGSSNRQREKKQNAYLRIWNFFTTKINHSIKETILIKLKRAFSINHESKHFVDPQEGEVLRFLFIFPVFGAYKNINKNNNKTFFKDFPIDI
jgi:hypothetical protein